MPGMLPPGAGSKAMPEDNAGAGVIGGATPTISIADMDRAVAFYTETLGLRLAMRFGDHYAAIDTGNGCRLGLHPASEHAPTPGTPGCIQIGFGVTVPIEQAVRQLEQRGVRFRGPILRDDPVKLAFFSDPDGTELYLCEY